MTNLEFIKKEIKFLEDIVNMDLSKQKMLSNFQQIKTIVEAWEVVKKHLILDKEFHRIDLHLYHDTIYKEDYLKLKKALEVDDDKNNSYM